MDDKELVLSEEQLESVAGGATENLHMKCPHCGSTNIIPYHSPSKGTAYLCCDCYTSINIKEEK